MFSVDFAEGGPEGFLPHSKIRGGWGFVSVGLIQGGGGLSFSDLNTSNCCVDNYTTELSQAPRLNRRWQVEASQSFLMFFVFTSVC